MFAVIMRTTNGIKRLDSAMERFAHTQSLQVLPVKGNDEIAMLTTRFNEMQVHINDLLLTKQMAEKEKMRLHYEAQLAEINPHFLYNTLNSIKWTAIFSGSQNVADLIGSLGVLLEQQTSKNGEMQTLQETINILEHYMNLQYARFGERVHLQLDIPPEALSITIPKFCIQPLVENALLHGYEQQQKKGTIWISAVLQGDDILLFVKDDGAGMQASRILEVIDDMTNETLGIKKRSVGIKNIHKRIEYLYGMRYGIVFSTQLGVGTTFRIRLPQKWNIAKEDYSCIES